MLTTLPQRKTKTPLAFIHDLFEASNDLDGVEELLFYFNDDEYLAPYHDNGTWMRCINDMVASARDTFYTCFEEWLPTSDSKGKLYQSLAKEVERRNSSCECPQLPSFKYARLELVPALQRGLQVIDSAVETLEAHEGDEAFKAALDELREASHMLGRFVGKLSRA